MRILLVHEYYRERGGEDESFEREAALLERLGHEVIRHTVHNDAVDERRPLRLAQTTVWNQDARRKLRALAQSVQPDVAHFHNTFPLLSPAAIRGVKDAGVPAVVTLRNYRLVCPSALLFRNGAPCEDCVGRRFAWPGVLHACYRTSRAATAVTAATTAVHRIVGTWDTAADVLLTLSQFARSKLIEGGLDPVRIVVKPNFVDPDPGPGTGSGDYAMFVGRLAPEKGLPILLSAWESIGDRLPLRIVGDGPLAHQVRAAVTRLPSVEWIGRRPIDEVFDLLGDARCLVFPSQWYETFGRVGMEALAKGTPVLGTDLGAIAELVDDGRTGFRFRAGDPAALVDAVERFLSLDGEAAGRMRRAARHEFEHRYSADANHTMLLDVYQRVVER